MRQLTRCGWQCPFAAENGHHPGTTYPVEPQGGRFGQHVDPQGGRFGPQGGRFGPQGHCLEPERGNAGSEHYGGAWGHGPGPFVQRPHGRSHRWLPPEPGSVGETAFARRGSALAPSRGTCGGLRSGEEAEFEVCIRIDYKDVLMLACMEAPSPRPSHCWDFIFISMKEWILGQPLRFVPASLRETWILLPFGGVPDTAPDVLGHGLMTYASPLRSVQNSKRLCSSL
ncbi:hypothetical protein TOPH_05253, partial [Tolypocladium ophioglossoides CBS 100239]